jgi:hypothetical protein
MAVETADIDEFDGNDLPEHVDKQFFVEEKIPMFNNPKAYEDLRVAISTSEFPIVVQPGFSPKLGSFPHANHSFIVFGADSEGEIVCWDKQGWGLDSPFRVISFDEIYDKYKQSSYWGIRQLRNLTAVQKWNLEDIQIPQAKRTSFWSLFKSNNN